MIGCGGSIIVPEEEDVVGIIGEPDELDPGGIQFPFMQIFGKGQLFFCIQL